MVRKQIISPRTEFVTRLALSFVFLWSTVDARDLLRRGASSAVPGVGSTAGAGAAPSTAPAGPSGADRLAVATQALQAVRAMQQAAHDTATSGSAGPAGGSWNVTNGLKPLRGAPWVGATVPVLPDGSSNITITQTQQQAILNWETFNLSKETTLNFDQSAGGSNVGQWIAFNKVGVTGSPSQILGKINAQGQVYVINPNGIIFGGSSQVNAHALVASSLPINDNLIKSGVLNNPDAQFLFSALPQVAGKNGTPAFTPVVIDEFLPPTNTDAVDLKWKAAPGLSPSVEIVSASTTPLALKAGVDYTVSLPGTDGRIAVAFTDEGLKKVPAGSSYVQVAYTPTGDQFGNVVTRAGARLTAPTTVDHVGGRIALVGANVTNTGSISTADGQTILAAGLQVGFTPHASTDPTLRGLDVFVGAVEDPALNLKHSDDTVTYEGKPAGMVTNDRSIDPDVTVNPNQRADVGLIEAPRGAVTLTGKTVNQLGFISSSTAVSYNGRVDLIAGYNAVANPKYDPSSTSLDFTLTLPFLFQSNINNLPTGTAIGNAGQVTLGANSVLQILPETADAARIPGDLALPSQVNIQGNSVHLEEAAKILAPGAKVPLQKAYGFDGLALEAGVTIRAGSWFNPGDSRYSFVQSADTQQIYFDSGAKVDVAGLSGVAASVTDNVVSVELRGAELADFPLQRDGFLRGQTVQVDLRKHGPWDPKLNNGLGGYSWVGTPLANTAGWVALADHTVGQLSVDGGSVSLRAGGAVVLNKGSVVDVSGGSIDYAGGLVETTKLLANGQVYDIAEANPDRIYTGILSPTITTTDPKWGVTTTSPNPLFQGGGAYENSYTQGGSGGSLSIRAPAMALDGTMSGTSLAGKGQRDLSPLFNPGSPPDPANPVFAGVNRWLINVLSRPLPAEFSLTIGRQYLNAAGQYVRYSPTPTNIVFRGDATPTVVNPFASTGEYLFPTERLFELALSPDLFSAASGGGGFGIAQIDNSDDALGLTPGYGNISLKQGTKLALSPGGSLTLSAGNITVGNGAEITAPSGQIVLNAFTLSNSVTEEIFRLKEIGGVPEASLPVYDPLRGKVVVGSGTLLSTEGAVVDDRIVSSDAGLSANTLAGGTIAVNASNISLDAESRLSVSGGTIINSGGRLSYGNAGDIVLKSGVAYTGDRNIGPVLGGRLNLNNALLEGYAGVGRKGGSLTLQAPSVAITNLVGGGTAITDAENGALSLRPDFFDTGGFSSFTVSGLGVAVVTSGKKSGVQTAFSVAPYLQLTPLARTWLTVSGAESYLPATGLRQPVNLTFKTAGLLLNANGVPIGNDIALVVGAGAILGTDPGGRISLSGGTIDVLGQISAPGGSISLNQSSVGSQNQFLPGLYLGAASVLSAKGITTYAQDLTGYHKADVLDGGTITVTGNIVAEKGAVINVSGASDTIMVKPGQLSQKLSGANGIELVPVRKDSSGGKVTLQGEQVLFSAATLFGGSGGSMAGGGDLSVMSNVAGYSFINPRTNADGSTDLFAKSIDPVLILESAQIEFQYGGLGQAVKNKVGEIYGDAQGLGSVHFSTHELAGAGFGSLTFGTGGRGAISVQGNVALDATRKISLADGGVISFASAPGPGSPLASTLDISAPYVELGQPFQPPQQTLGLTATPSYGTGRLSVRAGTLVDVGNLVLKGAGTATIDATAGGTTAGAIRGNGTLNLAGDITLQAGQIYPPTGASFNIVASDYTLPSDLEPTVGSVTIRGSPAAAPVPSLPLSAGGALNISAGAITQGGVLRAPLGQIHLGADQNSGLNPFTGESLPVTNSLVLEPGSVTSISALDPATGQPVTIPYGINVNGDTWYAPTGADITSTGPGTKAVSMTAASIDLQAAASGKAAAKIDLAGGGDLFAYQFVPGTGGSTDVLLGSTSASFAIIPSFVGPIAPVAPFSTSTDAQINLGGDPGYVTSNALLNYRVGDRIHLEAGGGLQAGDYTLLPARYALLPGAYLISAQKTAPTAGAAVSFTRPDGAAQVAGYRYNALDGAGRIQRLFDTFVLAPQSVVQKRAEYVPFTATNFFQGIARTNDTVSPLLPLDAGRLALAATTSLQLNGKVVSAAATGGRGGTADISSTADIFIGSVAALAAQQAENQTGYLLLDSAQLSTFGLESLLIGGTRSVGDKGTSVTVTTGNIVVDNAGAPLTGPDVILAANRKVALLAGAELGQSGQTAISADPLTFVGSFNLEDVSGRQSLTVTRGGAAIVFPSGLAAGTKLNPTVSGVITSATGNVTTFAANTPLISLEAGSKITLDAAGTLTAEFPTAGTSIPVQIGDGTVVRVGGDPSSTITRTGVVGSATPELIVGEGVRIRGASVVLDSTNLTQLSPNLDLSSINALSLDSGRISLLLDEPGIVPADGTLVLSRTAQDSLFKAARALSLTSYSTLDFHGTGFFGSSNLDTLGLHAGTIRGFLNSDDPTAGVTVVGNTIKLDNAKNAVSVAVPDIPTGYLTVKARSVQLGGNQLEIQNFKSVDLIASDGVQVGDTAQLAARRGSLIVRAGDLTIDTPRVVAATGTSGTIAADGDLTLLSNSGVAPGTTEFAPGLGASLGLTGANVKVSTAVRLPSGSLSLVATAGDLTVAGGTLDVGGTARQFFDVTKYTDGGQLNLSALGGNLSIETGSKLNVAASTGGGSAGTISLLAPNGDFEIAPDTLTGHAGAADKLGGAFILDTVALPGGSAAGNSLATLLTALSAGGFDRSVDLRLREGDVRVDGNIRTHDFTLSADSGSINVTGGIDASGLLGASRNDPLAGVINPADPTGGSIALSASGNVNLATDSWLSVAGFAYSNAGKGGSITLAAGSYVNRNGTGSVDQTAAVSVADGAMLDFGVKNKLTPNDLLLNPGVSQPTSQRTDLTTGTLLIRESQQALDSGVQFAGLADSVHDASSIALEGFQVFELSGAGGTVSTNGAITSVGSNGVLDTAVQQEIQKNGTAFLAGVDAAMLADPLYHFQPGAEVVNNTAPATAANLNLITLNNSVSNARSLVNFNLLPGNGVFTSVLIPGGLPQGVTLKTTNGRSYTLTTADGSTSAIILAGSSTTIGSASASNPIVAVNFRNSGNTALSTQLNFNSGSVPFTLAFGTDTAITSANNAARFSSKPGDLLLANTWDLSGTRYGPGMEPGRLTLRAQGDLVFGFDASLNDGFDPANPSSLAYPLWTAQLQSGLSTSYRLVAGGDYSAADTRVVQRPGPAAGAAGSVLIGKGALSLPTATGNAASRSATIPRFFQTIRTGTGNIEIAAARDVQFLNPLATVYTAGRKAADLPGFDVPVLDSSLVNLVQQQEPYYPAQYSLSGGNVSIRAQNDIARYIANGSSLDPASVASMPNNWLYRRGSLGDDGKFATLTHFDPDRTEVQSTSWWIDYSNFFADVGALGGGNVSLTAGRNISNVNATAPTNARMPGKDSKDLAVKPDATKLVELGGGDVRLQAGADVDGGVYYAERGAIGVVSGGAMKTNVTRAAVNSSSADVSTWLPTTFFLGKGRLDVTTAGDLRIGSVANTFMLPQGEGNRLYESTFFSTANSNNQVNLATLGGTVTLQVQPDAPSTTSLGSGASLLSWYSVVLNSSGTKSAAASRPWLRNLTVGSLPYSNYISSLNTLSNLLPGTIRATAFGSDIDIVGTLNLAPSPTGTIELLAAKNINGVRINGINAGLAIWGSALIDLSDSDPARLPSVASPLGFAHYQDARLVDPRLTLFPSVNALFAERGGTDFSLEEKLALHGSVVDSAGKARPLHFGDTNPVRLYAAEGDLSGLTLFSGKSAKVVAGNDLRDLALHIQNTSADDNTVVAAGRDITAYDPASPLRVSAQLPGNVLSFTAGSIGRANGAPNSGDIQVSGPGSMQLLAGRNLSLGSGNTPTTDGTAVGVTSVGATRNPYLPQDSGANLTVAAGMGQIYSSDKAGLNQTPGLATTSLNFTGFVNAFLNPNLTAASAEAARYLPLLAKLMNLTSTDAAQIWSVFGAKTKEQQAALALEVFQLVLRNAARDRNNPDSPDFGTYKNGFKAIAALFPGSPEPTEEDLKSTVPVVRPAGPWRGNLLMPTKEIKTFEGGNISLLVPGGETTVGRATDPQKSDQGVLTERGGNISIVSADNINVGTSRVFTLRGGDEVIWSTWGDIAAGSGSKTVYAAPPTRVLIDPQSGDVQNDLAGLATGSGIGVLATLSGVEPGDVDLIAPVGTIDAGDAGIRSSGNLNIAARVVLNASNIQVGGTSAGTPPPPPAPNISSLSAATTASAGASTAATDVAKQNAAANRETALPSLISVEVLGYGGGDDDDSSTSLKSDDDTKSDEEKKEEEAKKKKAAEDSETAGH